LRTLPLDEARELGKRIGPGLTLRISTGAPMRAPQESLEFLEINWGARSIGRSAHDPPRVASARSTRPGKTGNVSTP
jgi:hypothetical protein